jgi:tyrosyl-DNA phosphodiesterase 2
MTFLLDYLRRVIDACRDKGAGSLIHGEPDRERSYYPTPPPANVMMLQEVTREAFDAILNDQWVRDYYQIVPSSPDEWIPEPTRGEECGNVILVTRSLPVVRPKIIHFADTTENRTAVMFDTLLGVPRYPRAGHTTRQHEKRTTATLRLACTQLESGELGVFSRRHQLEATSLEITDNSLDGAVLAGDMNVAHSGDLGMPQLVGLSDAETRAEGNSAPPTWGYHPGKCGKQPCRRDKILYWQNRKRFWVNEIRTLGIGLKMRNGQYVTEHYGIMTSVEALE